MTSAALSCVPEIKPYSLASVCPFWNISEQSVPLSTEIIWKIKVQGKRSLWLVGYDARMTTFAQSFSTMCVENMPADQVAD